jgi:hypothetical protein
MKNVLSIIALAVIIFGHHVEAAVILLGIAVLLSAGSD